MAEGPYIPFAVPETSERAGIDTALERAPTLSGLRPRRPQPVADVQLWQWGRESLSIPLDAGYRVRPNSMVAFVKVRQVGG